MRDFTSGNPATTAQGQKNHDAPIEESAADISAPMMAAFWRASLLLLERLGQDGKAFCLCPTDEKPPIDTRNLSLEQKDNGCGLTFPNERHQLLLIRRYLDREEPPPDFFDRARESMAPRGLLYFDFVDASRSSLVPCNIYSFG